MNEWYFERTDLAAQYLQILDIGISSNLAIIAPRRKGKTLFILNDISTLAKKQNFIPIYASLWQNTNSPQAALISALEEMIEALDKKTPLSRIMNTKLKKAELGNELFGKLGFEFADKPQRTQNKELILLDKLLSQLQKKAPEKTILLLIDEIQHLATSTKFDALSFALRTMLDKRAGKVKAIFTGSSRHYMNILFNDTKSPFYHFAENVPFPDLGNDFLDFIENRLREKGVKQISEKKLAHAFESVDRSPYWMMKVISRTVTFNNSLNDSLSYVLELISAAEGFDEIAKKLKPIDKLVFKALAMNESPFSNKLLEKITRETPVKGIVANVQRSLHRLSENQLVTKITKGDYVIEKPGFKEYLAKIEKGE